MISLAAMPFGGGVYAAFVPWPGGQPAAIAPDYVPYRHLRPGAGAGLAGAGRRPIRRRPLLQIGPVLQELSVENLLLIESARLRLAGGLNVITGETGAGKSVLAHALDLLLGGRARSGIVRPGTAEAYVEGVFDLPADLDASVRERLPGDAEEIMLARRVGADGRTRAYVNGRSATVADLGALASVLIRFYGQHEHRRLTISAAQLELLDQTCGDQHASHLRQCARALAECSELDRRLETLRERCRERERELDLLEHELSEIDAAAVDDQEHGRLHATRERLRRRDGLCAATGAAAEELAPETAEAPGAAVLLASAAARLGALVGADADLDSLAQRLRSLAIDSQEAAAELRAYRDELLSAASSGEALEEIEQRLDAVERLMRKHGGSVQAIHAYAANARARRELLLSAGVDLADTDERLARARASLDEHVRALRQARQAAAPRLARTVHEQLDALGMCDASFEILIGERDCGPDGADSVEFTIAPNPGVPAGPVREIASGGELSRIMLALTTAGEAVAGGQWRSKSARAGAAGNHAGRQATLAFDELDAGIGGRSARAVGTRLRELARHRQLLCITHLPQIASLGERHFAIAKDTSTSPALATVIELGEREVVSELVRMLGAEASDSAARRHARDLRRAA